MKTIVSVVDINRKMQLGEEWIDPASYPRKGDIFVVSIGGEAKTYEVDHVRWLMSKRSSQTKIADYAQARSLVDISIPTIEMVATITVVCREMKIHTREQNPVIARMPSKSLYMCPYHDCGFRGTNDEVDDHRSSTHEEERQAGSNLKE